VVVVSAPSGSGKSTILGRVLRELPGLRFSVSHTTRPPREGEMSGREYHFVSDAAFEEHRAAGGFLESANVYGHRYGTSRDLYATDNPHESLWIPSRPIGRATRP